MERLSLRFQVLDETVLVETERPGEPARLDEVLPIFRILGDQVTEMAVRRNGGAVSCSKGCSMCCRIQPAPVTPAEAYAILRIVEGLPEPRQTEVRNRFADRVERLRAAGLGEIYLEGRQAPNAEEGRAIASRYLELELACPFLDDDACSIYEARPFVCRGYLVTSPKEWCAEPLTGAVRTVPVLLMPERAILETGAMLAGRVQHAIPLILALVYAEACRAELERTYPFTALLGNAIQQLSGGRNRAGA